MSTSDSLPDAIKTLDQMNLVAMWLETLFYGINIVVFGSVVYVLAFKRRRRGNAFKYLLAVTILLFSLATAHVAVSLKELIQAFIGASSVPHGAIYYFLDQTRPLSYTGQVLYALNVITQDLVVIWRLYVVWNSWKIALFPILVEVGHTISVFTVITRYYLGASLESKTIQQWGVAAWALDLAVNALGTLAIAYRLWSLGRKTASMKPGNRNSYLGIAFIILESGTMFSTATFILVILFVHTPTTQGAAAGISVVMQLATLSPLLIIVRVGLNLTHGSSSNNTTFAKSGVSNADVGNDTIRHNVSSAPVRVLVSQSEQVDFPREGGKGAYEMNMLDSESYNQKASFTTDSV